VIVANRVHVVTARRLGTVKTAARSQVGFTTDNRLDALLFRLGEELDGAEHVAMIGHRDGRHSRLPGMFEQGADLVRPIEQAVLSVDVEMDEAHKPAVNLLPATAAE